MKSAKGLARIPVLVAVLVVAAGGATFRAGQNNSGEAPVAPVAATSVTTVNADAPDAGEAAYLGEMTVSASRIRD